MTSRDFCYWLQGYFEVAKGKSADLPGSGQALTVDQCDVVKRHLAMVFVHEIDPTHGSVDHQAELQSIHDGKNDNPGLVMRC